MNQKRRTKPRLNENNVYAQKRGSSSNSSFICILFFVITALVTFSAYEYKEVDEGAGYIHEQEKIMKKLQMDSEEKINSLQQELKDVTNEKNAAQGSLHELEMKLKKERKKSDTGVKNDVQGELTEALDLAQSQISGLEKAMQKRAKLDVIERFGPGPHRVEIEIDFNPQEIPEGTASKFTIEMAPLDLMPYTVHFFLEQVSRGMWDGCSFHRNAGHVVQGGPVGNHLENKNLRALFQKSGYTSVAFQEYHPDFPHKKYTLGYAGRPGGPDFYVSVMDNTRNHGPGGQTSYKIKSEADPCFAKVVEGFDAVDRMHQLSVQEGGYKRLRNYVAIKKMTILNN